MKLRKRTILWIFISQLVFIAMICLMPIPEKATPDIANLDKLVHLSVYIWLSWLGAHCFSPLKSILLLICYGLAIEIIQPMTGYRSFELLDIVANTTGVFLGSLVFKFLKIPLISHQPVRSTK